MYHNEHDIGSSPAAFLFQAIASIAAIGVISAPLFSDATTWLSNLDCRVMRAGIRTGVERVYREMGHGCLL